MPVLVTPQVPPPPFPSPPSNVMIIKRYMLSKHDNSVYDSIVTRSTQSVSPSPDLSSPSTLDPIFRLLRGPETRPFAKRSDNTTRSDDEKGDASRAIGAVFVAVALIVILYITIRRHKRSCEKQESSGRRGHRASRERSQSVSTFRSDSQLNPHNHATIPDIRDPPPVYDPRHQQNANANANLPGPLDMLRRLNFFGASAVSLEHGVRGPLPSYAPYRLPRYEDQRPIGYEWGPNEFRT